MYVELYKEKLEKLIHQGETVGLAKEMTEEERFYLKGTITGLRIALQELKEFRQ